MLLNLISTVLFHPIRSGAGFLALFLACLIVGFWPGWDEAKFRAVGVGCFFVGLYDWARQLLGRDRGQS